MAVANPADLPVLVVEDNAGAAELARRALGRLGVTAVLAEDVEQALVELRRTAFSAVLLDYRLPKGDAWEVLEAAQAATPKIPVIVVTAMGDERVAAEAIRRGAADYLIKGEHLQTDLTQSLERVFSEHELERDKALLAAIVDSSEDAILCVALDGTVLTWNVGAEKIFGYTREEIVGRPVGTLYPPEDTDQAPSLVALAEQGGVRNLVAERLRKDGSRITVSLTISPLRNPHDRLIGTSSILRDITDQKRREREREAILAVSSALRGVHDQEQIMSVVLDEVQQFLRAAGSGFALRDRRTGETVVALACGVWERLNGLRLPPGIGIAHQVISSGKAFVTSDLDAEPSFTARNVVDPLPAAAACVPLVAHDENLGGLWANRNEPFSAADVRLLQAIADMAATALHRQALHEETNQRLHRLAALRSIDLAITSSLDLRLTLSVLLEQVMDQLELDAAAVLLVEGQTQTLRYAAGRGFRTRTIERTTLRLGEGAAGAAALDRRTELLDAGGVRHSLAESEGFVFSCIVPLIAKGTIKGVLEGHHRQPRQPDPEWVEFLETLASQAAIAIDNATLFDSLQRSNVELSLAYDTTIEGWSSALDLRDKETQGHSSRVTEMTLRLAREMGFGEAELVQVRRGALLHDIGKMGIPDAILLKAGPLTEDEWEVMRQHPMLAQEMLSPIAYLRSALDIPFCHHEKWDGSGYPRGLKGVEIPLAARIFAVADVWDALRSDRPYRPAWPAEKVRRHIEEQAGRHFDPAVVALFLQLDAV